MIVLEYKIDNSWYQFRLVHGSNRAETRSWNGTCNPVLCEILIGTLKKTVKSSDERYIVKLHNYKEMDSDITKTLC